MSLVIDPYRFKLPAAAAEQSYQGLVAKTSQTTLPITVNSVQTGAAATGRRIVCAIHWQNPSAAKTLSSAKIGGVPASILAQAVHSSQFVGAALIIADLDTGTSTDVEVTLASGAPYYNVWVASYRVMGLLSTTAIDPTTATPTNATSVSLNIGEQDDGVRFAALMAYAGSSNFNPTGMTERYDSSVAANHRAVGAGDDITATVAGKTITFTINNPGTGSFSGAAVAVSLR